MSAKCKLLVILAFWKFKAQKSSSHLITQQRREVFTTWNNLIYTLVRWRIWRESFGYGRSQWCGSCGGLEVRLTLNTFFSKRVQYFTYYSTYYYTIWLFESKKSLTRDIDKKVICPFRGVDFRAFWKFSVLKKNNKNKTHSLYACNFFHESNSVNKFNGI